VDPVLVVDVGTDTTMACVVVAADREPKILRDPSSREPGWPTSAARTDDGFLVGAAAEQLGTEQGLFRGRFLDALGEPGGLTPIGPPDELLAVVLRRLRGQAEREAGREVSRVLLTVCDPAAVPAGRSHEALRRGLLRAARLARFTDVELLCDAAAIAMPVTAANAEDDAQPPGYVLVCDAGASALRLSLVRTGQGDLGTDPGWVVSARAIAALGGDQIDLALAQDLRDQIAKGRRRAQAGGTAAEPEPAEYRRLARSVRERLTDEDRYEAMPGTLVPVTILYRRDNLRKLLKDPLRQLRDACRDVLASVSPTPRRPSGGWLSRVLLVGGGARAPFLVQALTEALRVDVRPVDQPDSACVRGATLWAQCGGRRVIPAIPHAPGTRELAWDFKEGGARLLKWMVGADGAFAPGDRLAATRSLRDDSVQYLTADCSGILRQHCVAERTVVDSGDVLAVVEVRVSQPSDLTHPPYIIRDLPDTRAVAFSPDGRALVVAGPDGAGGVRDMETGTETRWNGGAVLGGVVLGGPEGDVVFRRDMGWIAGLVTGRGVSLFAIATSQPLGHAVKVPDRDPAAIRFSADGTRACVLAGRDIRVWETGKGGRELLSAEKLEFYGYPEASFAYSGDGGTVLIAARDKQSRWRRKEPAGAALIARRVGSDYADTIWRLDEGGQADLRLAVTPDGSRAMLAVGHQLRLIDVPSGHELWRLELPGPVRAAVFSADGSLLVTVIQEPNRWTGMVWDARPDPPEAPEERGRLPHQFRLGPRPASWVLISPDTRFLVTGDDSNSAIWGLLP